MDAHQISYSLVSWSKRFAWPALWRVWAPIWKHILLMLIYRLDGTLILSNEASSTMTLNQCWKWYGCLSIAKWTGSICLLKPINRLAHEGKAGLVHETESSLMGKMISTIALLAIIDIFSMFYDCSYATMTSVCSSALWWTDWFNRWISG